MAINSLIMVLGKRLIDNQLTPEGRLRVDKLIETLYHGVGTAPLVMFCGGLTDGQHRSEAQAMADYFAECVAHNALPADALPSWLLEDNSTTSVENFYFAAKLLKQDPPVNSDSRAPLHVQLLSSDYHLKRIFAVQDAIPSQGMLTYFKDTLASQGLEIKLSNNIGDHLSVASPYQGAQATLFLLTEQLTLYRVYLEGVLHGTVERLDQPLASRLLDDAKQTLAAMQVLTAQHGALRFAKRHVAKLDKALNAFSTPLSKTQLGAQLTAFHQPLKALNLASDPDAVSR